MRVLHDGALQTLETVGSGRYGDMAGVQTLARGEAQRPTTSWREPAPPGTFIEGIDAMITDHVQVGLDVELSIDGATEPPSRVARALQDATNEALINVRKHAGIARRW